MRKWDYRAQRSRKQGGEHGAENRDREHERTGKDVQCCAMEMRNWEAKDTAYGMRGTDTCGARTTRRVRTEVYSGAQKGSEGSTRESGGLLSGVEYRSSVEG